MKSSRELIPLWRSFEKTVPSVRKLIALIFLSSLISSFAFMPLGEGKGNKSPVGTLASMIGSLKTTLKLTSPEELFNDMNLAEYGLSEQAFTSAYKGYQYLLTRALIPRTEYLSICDFSQSSRKKRFYLIDITNKCLVLNTYVAHGKNSGGEYANRFSNKPSSLQSSLGFYITQQTYFGAHGLALKIRGVDPGFNDKALQRNIVMHGSSYIDDKWLRRRGVMGRSYGCPAIPKKESANIINTIRNGTCLFIYHPGKKYLEGSKILND